MVTLPLETFPQHKAREQIRKMNIITGLSVVDTVYFHLMLIALTLSCSKYCNLKSFNCNEKNQQQNLT